MEPYQERVLNELSELSDKVQKLKAFLQDEEKVSKLSAKQKWQMTRQLVFMQAYAEVLQERIADFMVSA